MSSIRDAAEDGIERIPGVRHGTFLIPCEVCGRKIQRTSYSRKRTYICDYCKGVIKKKLAPTIPDTETKAERRFKTAVRRVREQVKDFSKYEHAVEIARKRVEKYGSIPEAMMAIGLLQAKFAITPQQRIGKYNVDFLIPKHKAIVEVDGGIYHTNMEREARRDLYLKAALGFDWVVIHVPAERIEQSVVKSVMYVQSRVIRGQL